MGQGVKRRFYPDPVAPICKRVDVPARFRQAWRRIKLPAGRRTPEMEEGRMKSIARTLALIKRLGLLAK
jgi:hypothetical protein